MLGTLRFEDFDRAQVGYHATARTFGQYQTLRQRGCDHAVAIERILYGECHA